MVLRGGAKHPAARAACAPAGPVARSAAIINVAHVRLDGA